MMLQVDIPDSLARQVTDLAANQHVSANQVVAAALTAHVGAWQVRDDIETRAKRGN
jgi:predicted HicB family RNase H-like nuclease